MADISALAGLQAGDPLDFDIYVDAKESVPPPAKGRYVVRAPSNFTFSATQQGFLSAQVDPTIIGPRNEGVQIKFTRVSAKPFKRGAITVSQLGDYLRAAGSAARPRTPQEQADAVEQTAGATYQVDIDWEAYHKDTKWSQKGMETFPRNEDGTYNPWIEVPGVKDPVSGDAVRVRANVKVERFVSVG